MTEPLVVTQTDTSAGLRSVIAFGSPHAEGAPNDHAPSRIVRIDPDGTLTVLTRGLHGACDPAVSFDAKRILFAGKQHAGDRWAIYEVRADGSGLRKVIETGGDCRQPIYLSSLYTIVSAKPWHTLLFVKTEPGRMDESGQGPVTNLYGCRLDGSGLQQLTFNLSGDSDPFQMDDGRVIYAARQRLDPTRRDAARVTLLGINLDGTDCALFTDDGPPAVRRMPCATQRYVVFVEPDPSVPDGGGRLEAVTVRRPLHSYQPVTTPDQGLFHSPSPLPDGRILVSRRGAARRGAAGDDTSGTNTSPGNTYGVVCLDIETGQFEPVFDDPRYHDIQAVALVPRTEPDGRSSVVSRDDPHGKLYCLSVYTNDLPIGSLEKGQARRLRVIEGLPVTAETQTNDPRMARNTVPVQAEAGRSTAPAGPANAPRPVPRRILGDIPLAADGSFHVTIPAGVPIELQVLDADGLALRTCGWIWAMNHEPRGCIGCHEDPELTPENFTAEAILKPAVPLTLPPSRRRSVTFVDDVLPILVRRCSACHVDHPKLALPLATADARTAGTTDERGITGADAAAVYTRLLEGADTGSGRYVHPGRARTSPLIWRLLGRDTRRPWDIADDPTTAARSANVPPPGSPVASMPPAGATPLTNDEKQTLIEWIDLGAAWDTPATIEPGRTNESPASKQPDQLPGTSSPTGSQDSERP